MLRDIRIGERFGGEREFEDFRLRPGRARDAHVGFDFSPAVRSRKTSITRSTALISSFRARGERGILQLPAEFVRLPRPQRDRDRAAPPKSILGSAQTASRPRPRAYDVGLPDPRCAREIRSRTR